MRTWRVGGVAVQEAPASSRASGRCAAARGAATAARVAGTATRAPAAAAPPTAAQAGTLVVSCCMAPDQPPPPTCSRPLPDLSFYFSPALTARAAAPCALSSSGMVWSRSTDIRRRCWRGRMTGDLHTSDKFRSGIAQRCGGELGHLGAPSRRCRAVGAGHSGGRRLQGQHLRQGAPCPPPAAQLARFVHPHTHPVHGTAPPLPLCTAAHPTVTVATPWALTPLVSSASRAH